MAPTAAVLGPGLNVTPGASNVTECSGAAAAGSASVTVIVTVSPSLTTSCGPGRLAVAVVQSPGVEGIPNPQIGTVVAGAVVGSGAKLPGTAQRLMDTLAAATEELARPSPAVTNTVTSSAVTFLNTGVGITGLSFASLLLMARRRRAS